MYSFEITIVTYGSDRATPIASTAAWQDIRYERMTSTRAARATSRKLKYITAAARDFLEDLRQRASDFYCPAQNGSVQLLCPPLANEGAAEWSLHAYFTQNDGLKKGVCVSSGVLTIRRCADAPDPESPAAPQSS